MNQKKSKAGLENQRDIPRAHIGFYTQCGKGLENQRHHDMHRLLHSEWHRAEEPEKIPRAHTGFYTQCGAGLENQRDILSAHTGFYAQCSTGKIYKKISLVHIK